MWTTQCLSTMKIKPCKVKPQVPLSKTLIWAHIQKKVSGRDKACSHDTLLSWVYTSVGIICNTISCNWHVFLCWVIFFKTGLPGVVSLLMCNNTRMTHVHFNLFVVEMNVICSASKDMSFLALRVLHNNCYGNEINDANVTHLSFKLQGGIECNTFMGAMKHN